MKYEDCLTCGQLGISCDGPNFFSMDVVELGQWCNEKRKKMPGMTYDRIAAETGVSKTAVYNFLSGAHPDCRTETIRPILKLLTGGKWDDNPCGNVSNSEKAAYEEKIRQFEKDISWRDDKIAHLSQSYEAMQTLIVNTNKRNTDDKDFLRSQIKGKNRTIAWLAVALAFCLFVIVGALIVDRINPDIGFFWLRSWFGGNAGIRG